MNRAPRCNPVYSPWATRSPFAWGEAAAALRAQEADAVGLDDHRRGHSDVIDDLPVYRPVHCALGHRDHAVQHRLGVLCHAVHRRDAGRPAGTSSTR